MYGHASTVVIMKVKGTDEILGRYNPLAWDANTRGMWDKTNDSFIFSLKNGNIQNSILSRVKNRDYAVYKHHKTDQKTHGPNFGNTLYMYSPNSNFTLENNSVRGYCGGIIAANCSIVDYEVFKVIKKTS